MKKRIIIVLGILIAAGGIGSGVWYHFNGSGQSGSGDTVVCRCSGTTGNCKR